METIELTIERDGRGAGYLRLEYSPERDVYYTDIIHVCAAYRRQGIGSELMAMAEKQLGYIPEPEAIVHNAAARAFWSRRGFTEGFNQEKLET